MYAFEKTSITVRKYRIEIHFMLKWLKTLEYLNWQGLKHTRIINFEEAALAWSFRKGIT